MQTIGCRLLRRLRRRVKGGERLLLGAVCVVLVQSCHAQKPEQAQAVDPDKLYPGEFAPGLTYTNYRYADVPWSIHVAKANRGNPALAVLSIHAQGGVGDVSRLSDQVEAIPPESGKPLAAVNGDFYARDRSAYAGDPRGLQIVNGDLISSPIGGVAFWLDAAGQPHTTNVESQFRATLPDGTSVEFRVNQQRREQPVLYTPAMGRSTFTSGGLELVLEHAGEGPWLPLKVSETFTARVREVRSQGNTRLAAGTMVLSFDPRSGRAVTGLDKGAVLKISTATTPSLRGATEALSGGPVLVRDGQVQRIRLPKTRPISYEFRSMVERHPRAAVGWNHQYFFLMQVDGRQAGLSMGMTLEELGSFAAKRLGCTHAMNLDGGVSATFWADGRVRNSPANHGQENPVANSVVVVRRNAASGTDARTSAGTTPARAAN